MARFRRRVAAEPDLATSVPVQIASPASRRPIATASQVAGAGGGAGWKRLLPWSALSLLVIGAAIAYLVYGLRVGNFQNDEEQYTALARYISVHFPSALWQSGLYPRGTQRLDPTILALPFALMGGPGAFQVAHAIQSLLFASTAVPVFALARRSGIGTLASLLAAALSILVPWSVVSTSFLAESAAYPAYAWVLYTAWLTARSPSMRNDGLALLALVIAALSRAAMLALAPVLVLGVAWHEWAWVLRDKPRLGRLRALPGRLWSAHRLLSVVAALGLVALLINWLGILPGHGVSSLAGGYGIPHLESLSSVAARYRDYLSRIVVGTGVVAAVVAIPWLVVNLVRPRTGGRHALAVVCVLGLGVILLSLLQAGLDERYVLYGAAPVALATAAALADWARAPHRSPATVAGLLASAALVVLLIDSVSWPELASPYDFFTYAAAIFYKRVLLIHAGLVHLPLVHPGADTLVYASIVLVAAGFAASGRSARLAVPAAIALGAFLLALSATQTVYVLRKFTQTAGGATGPSAQQRSWVDRSVPAGTRVAALGVSMGSGISYIPVWRATEFWNISVSLDAYFGSPGALPFPIYSNWVALTVQPVTGLLSGSMSPLLSSPAFVPRYMLVPQQGTNSVGIAGHLLGDSSYLPLELIELAQPPRLQWSTSGTSPEGFLSSGIPAKATVYSGVFAGGGRRCASFSLLAPPLFAGHWPYTVISGGHMVARGSLVQQQVVKLVVALHPRRSARGASASLAVRVKGQERYVNGLTVSAKLAFFQAGPCPAPKVDR